MDLKSEQSGLGLMCYQNIVSVPMFLCVAGFTGEASRWSDLAHHTSGIPTKVYAAGLVSCIACVSMGVATFAVANVSYRLITLIVGAVVDGNNVGFLGFVG